MVRALRAQLPDRVEATFTCLECKHVKITTDATVSSTAIGTVETRKRMRVTMDIEDDASSKKERRQFCDVCQRLIGSGWIRGGREKDKRSVQGMAEIVCSSCDARYQRYVVIFERKSGPADVYRCTDCGGGGGSRLNVGKWRLKEVFPPGRKTCSLSHSRYVHVCLQGQMAFSNVMLTRSLGDRQRDIGVHVTPSDFDQQELREVLVRCKELWREKNLSRLAVPEMME
jgi:transcription elongation factor Elf1